MLGMAVTGHIVGASWHPYLPQHGELLDVAFTYSDLIWPWSGHFAVHLAVKKEGANFDGLAQGHVSLTIESPFEEGNCSASYGGMRIDSSNVFDNSIFRFRYMGVCAQITFLN